MEKTTTASSNCTKHVLEKGEDHFESDPETGGEEEVDNGWDDWGAEEGEPEGEDLLCLFCESRFGDSEALFEHCRQEHKFDFRRLRSELGLDFYGSFKLINYVRAQVSENRCWTCCMDFQCCEDLLTHLHGPFNLGNGGQNPWEDEKYLKPFITDDALLHSFADNEFEDEEYSIPVDEEDLISELRITSDIIEMSSNSNTRCSASFNCFSCDDMGTRETSEVDLAGSKAELLKDNENDTVTDKETSTATNETIVRHLKVSLANVAAKELQNVNDNYFGAYGSFGIHREMISDTVRMDAYRGAILNNPSLMNKAIVLDVGCGTGILSLFAAQAGASRVIAVEASEKMASIAKQIAEDNGLLCGGSENGRSGVVEVVQCMVEGLDKITQIPHNGIDILVSEWMGYCLLYESMLSSVLYARDHWLKPGGAILPDTATIFAAGIGKGGTSIPFWENVYGFDMSCIGKEVSEDASCCPIVDVVDASDILTDSVVVNAFDLLTMKPDEVDFTASFELQLKQDLSRNSDSAKSSVYWCYGIILWFETGFTSRFCKEMPTVLSTSPYSTRTHWSQTILTFRKPIAMLPSNCLSNESDDVGAEHCPAARIESRISIARASAHRSIDISMELTGISCGGRRHKFPVQIFNL